MSPIALLCVILISVLKPSVGNNGLRCYVCGFSSTDTDQSCLTITNDTASLVCPYRYCTILRQEFQDPAGRISSFNRGCSDRPDHLNHEVEDANFRTFYRACTSDLCNIGDGIQPITGGNLSPYPSNTGPNLVVPGTGSMASTAPASLQISFSLLLFMGCVVFLQ